VGFLGGEGSRRVTAACFLAFAKGDLRTETEGFLPPRRAFLDRGAGFLPRTEALFAPARERRTCFRTGRLTVRPLPRFLIAALRLPRGFAVELPGFFFSAADLPPLCFPAADANSESGPATQPNAPNTSSAAIPHMAFLDTF
jgi:hypothetical protein